MFHYIQNDHIIWEQQPLEVLAKERQLSAFFHQEFWHPMDTLCDKASLEELWSSGKAPWKLWKNMQQGIESTVGV